MASVGQADTVTEPVRPSATTVEPQPTAIVEPAPAVENVQATPEKTPDEIVTEVLARFGTPMETKINKSGLTRGLQALKNKAEITLWDKIGKLINQGITETDKLIVKNPEDIARLQLEHSLVVDPPNVPEPNSVMAKFDVNRGSNKQIIERFIRSKLQPPAVASR